MPGKIDVKNTDFDFLADGVRATATKNTTTTIDYKIIDTNAYISGGRILTNKAIFGDYFAIEIIDKDNVLGYGYNTVLQTYVRKWYVDPVNHSELEAPYAGKPPFNTYLRLTYTSTGTTDDVDVAVVYHLHLENM